MEPNFEAIGKAFAEQYFSMFDQKATRPQVACLYEESQGMLTFEGKQCQGLYAIGELLQQNRLNNVTRAITSIDSQPMHDGGILVVVVGQLKEEDQQCSLAFNQTFILKKDLSKNSWVVTHDIFRLGVHNWA